MVVTFSIVKTSVLGGGSVTTGVGPVKAWCLMARWGSVDTCGPAGAGGPVEICVFTDGSVGTVRLGWEPVGTCN